MLLSLGVSLVMFCSVVVPAVAFCEVFYVSTVRDI